MDINKDETNNDDEDFLNGFDFGSETPGPPAYTESFLIDMSNLIERYCREFELDYLYVIGCLDLQKRVLLDAIVEASLDSEDDDEEEALNE